VPRKIEQARWQHYIQLRQLGWSKTAAAREAKISLSAATAYEKGLPNSSGDAMRKARQAQEVPGAIPLDRLSPEALRALDDFGYFRRRYFGRISTPWQEEAGYRVVELLASPHKEFAVINAPPGSGKSVLFVHDIPAWLTCRNRAIRGMLGSASQALAERYSLLLRTTLESPFPFRSEPEEIERGLAVDAEAVLCEDYGAFRPDATTLWSVKAFIVAQLDDRPLTHKEPTWSAYGQDTAQIGGRYDVIFWDDLVDDRSVRTLEAIEGQRRWWDTIAEKRLEPGGLIVLQGQRLSPDDLYRHSLDKPAPEEADSSHVSCCSAEPDRKYHHIVYAAHDEGRCAAEHGPDAPYWPNGCLLDPRRLSWRDLDAEMKASLSTFETVYQQQDFAPEAMLVHPLWVSGGTDPETHEVHPGCWDDDRAIGTLPKGLGRCLSVASTDPSGSQLWGSTWWLWDPVTDMRFLIDVDRHKMQADQFLGLDMTTDEFTGLAEDWWQRSVKLGRRITHWIVERSAAQRYLYQNSVAKRWATARQVTWVPHDTNRNKLDPRLGVEALLRPAWRYGKVRLPGSPNGGSRGVAMKLVDEVTKWRGDGRAHHSDVAMSQWFFEHNLLRPGGLRSVATAPPLEPDERPSWLRDAP
jgi:hypothetical protein